MPSGAGGKKGTREASGGAEFGVGVIRTAMALLGTSASEGSAVAGRVVGVGVGTVGVGMGAGTVAVGSAGAASAESGRSTGKASIVNDTREAARSGAGAVTGLIWKAVIRTTMVRIAVALTIHLAR